MKYNLALIRDKLQSGFYGFWVRKWRVTFLLMGLMILVWLFSLFTISKESNPDIEYGIISINTIYLWANPEDIDNLITEKIEKEIKDIDWVKKITSNSFVGLSSIVVELENEAKTNDVLIDMKDAVDKTELPADAEDPIVTELSSDNEVMFNLLLYSDQYSVDYLKQKAKNLKETLDWDWWINRIDIWWWSEREIVVFVDKYKVEKLWLSNTQIAQTLKSFNINQPLWNHQIWELNYDFRVDWEIKDIEDIKKIPLSLWWNDFIFVWDIATVEYRLEDDRIAKMWTYKNPWNNFVILVVNKESWENIFTASKSAKNIIEEELQKLEYEWINYVYSVDIAESINDDYWELAVNWLTTLILVFLVMFFFVWLKEWLIATITVPLAFFVTFFVLDQLWLSLNFLTNFSLIVCFWIAIDATVVVIQWAHEKMREWFNPKTAVLLSVRDYKIPLIAWTMTTLVVFLPMMTLPWIMGKYLAYIPITIFVTLLASLFISLTLNSALYYKLSKPNKKYKETSPDDEKYMLADDKILLNEERKWKEKAEIRTSFWRDRMLDRLGLWYSSRIGIVMKSPKTRFISIVSPIILLLLSIIFISPKLGFNLFPFWDNQWMYITIEWQKGLDQDVLYDQISWLDTIISEIPEIKTYYYTIEDNEVSAIIELVEKDLRDRDSFEIEEQLINNTNYLATIWLSVETKVETWWPPSGKAVWVKLIANSNEKFSLLLDVAKDFESFLNEQKGTKNVSISSSESPGQFVFNLDYNKLAVFWINPLSILSELYYTTNWIWAGTFNWELDDYDIKVEYKEFDDWLNPDDIENISINTQNWFININTISDYNFEDAIDQISREDTKIIVKVESDLELGYTSTDIEWDLNNFATNYTYPDGISFEKWWENEENSDIIQAMIRSFLIALALIYAILLLQFNSYLQPVIILYSVLLWLLWANIWLWITWNSYSLAFMIWFIALTGIVVNNAIVLIDKINVSISRWRPIKDAILETWKSRLAPILSTALTTVLWLYSVAQQNDFFAGLSYTIMFGLWIATVMTLLIIPAIYHDKEKIIHLLKRSILSLILRIGIPIIFVFWICMLLLLFEIYLWKLALFIPLLLGLLIIYIFGYFIYNLFFKKEGEQTIVNKILWIKIVSIDWKPLTKRRIIKRIIINYLIFLSPIILWILIWFVFSKTGWSEKATTYIIIWLWYTIYILYNMYLVWINDNNQFIHDKICKTKVIQATKIEEDY